jgi:hypothetical protein
MMHGPASISRYKFEKKFPAMEHSIIEHQSYRISGYHYGVFTIKSMLHI